MLSQLRPSRALLVIDSLLFYLTHPKALLRRASFLLLILSVYLSLASFISLRRVLGSSLGSAMSAARAGSARWEQHDAEAAVYVAPPPTAEQRENLDRLQSLVDVLESGFDWRVYAPATVGTSASAEAVKPQGVTAVLLHWKRRKGMELVMRHLARYPYIREIIIWNNKPGIDLSPEVSATPLRRAAPRAQLAARRARQVAGPLPWLLDVSMHSPESSTRRRTSVCTRRPARACLRRRCACSTLRRTCTTPASTLAARWPRTTRATSTTMTGSMS